MLKHKRKYKLKKNIKKTIINSIITITLCISLVLTLATMFKQYLNTDYTYNDYGEKTKECTTIFNKKRCRIIKDN